MMIMVVNLVPLVYELTVASTPPKLQPHKGEDGKTTTDLTERVRVEMTQVTIGLNRELTLNLQGIKKQI